MQTNHPSQIKSKHETITNKIRSDIHNLQVDYNITYNEYSRRRGIENVLLGIALVLVIGICILAGAGIVNVN